MTLITFYFGASDDYLRGVIRGTPAPYPPRIQRMIAPDDWVYVDRLVGAMSRYCLKHKIQYGGCEHSYAPSVGRALALWAEQDHKRTAQEQNQ